MCILVCVSGVCVSVCMNVHVSVGTCVCADTSALW